MVLELSRRIAVCVLVIFVLGSCLADANAQKRRTKKSRRVTNPVTSATPSASPASNDPTIVSTAEESAAEQSATTNSRRSKSKRTTQELDQDATREKVDRLTNQIGALNDKLSQMEMQQRTLVDLERLSRAETRAEALRAQLRDVQTKQADLQVRSLQLDYELQPSVIERTMAVSGSTRPEDVREARRRQLEAEKALVQSQLTQLANNRSRLEAAIATAELEADRLRARIDSVTDQPVPPDTISTDVGVAPVTPTQPGEGSEGPPQ